MATVAFEVQAGHSIGWFVYTSAQACSPIVASIESSQLILLRGGITRKCEVGRLCPFSRYSSSY
jgi:hypothetical protein